MHHVLRVFLAKVCAVVNTILVSFPVKRTFPVRLTKMDLVIDWVRFAVAPVQRSTRGESVDEINARACSRAISTALRDTAVW